MSRRRGEETLRWQLGPSSAGTYVGDKRTLNNQHCDIILAASILARPLAAVSLFKSCSFADARDECHRRIRPDSWTTVNGIHGVVSCRGTLTIRFHALRVCRFSIPLLRRQRWPIGRVRVSDTLRYLVELYVLPFLFTSRCKKLGGNDGCRRKDILR